jgi:hypothetical protein
MPLLVAKGSMRVEALPGRAGGPDEDPASFLSRQADRNAARSIVRIRILIPTAAK